MDLDEIPLGNRQPSRSPPPELEVHHPQVLDYRPLKIEDDVQIFSKVTVTNSRGTRAIIGANSIVTKPIPPYCVAAGVPAKVIDYFGPPGEEAPELAERERIEGSAR